MARPREFDLEAALTGAMRLFWSRGYEESSLSNLLAAMKITKGSFYKAFSDKRAVYLQALEHYEDQVVKVTVKGLMDSSRGPGDARIIGLFKMIASAAHQDGDRMGCFLCNALIDRAVQDAEVEEKLQAMVFRLENGFRAALDSIPGHPGPDWVHETARGVLSLYFGLRVLGKAGLSDTMAEDCVKQVTRLIAIPS